MSKPNFAVIETIGGDYYDGFKSAEAAREKVHALLDGAHAVLDYEFKVVQVIHEWTSDDLLPGER